MRGPGTMAFLLGLTGATPMFAATTTGTTAPVIIYQPVPYPNPYANQQATQQMPSPVSPVQSTSGTQQQPSGLPPTTTSTSASETGAPLATVPVATAPVAAIPGKEPPSSPEEKAKTTKDIGSVLKPLEGTSTVPAVQGLQPGDVIRGSAHAVDGYTVSVNGQALRLYGITGPAPARVCTGRIVPWACGREATLFLDRLVQNEPLHCRVVSVNDPDLAPTAECFIGKDDVARVVVAAGMAWSHLPDYASVAAEARQAARGIWNMDVR